MKSIRRYLIIIICLIILIHTDLSSRQGPADTDKILRVRKTRIRNIFKSYRGRYLIYIVKNHFRLYIYNRRIQIIAVYPVGYGYNIQRKAKIHRGDNSTPEGLYKITEIYSLDHNKSEKTYRHLKALNDLYLKAEDGYYRYDDPSRDIGRGAFGPRMFRINYPNRNDIRAYKRALKKGLIPRDKKGEAEGIGSGISIHGNNYPSSIGRLSTAGCIIMRNKDIRKLDRFVTTGTPVFITRN